MGRRRRNRNRPLPHKEPPPPREPQYIPKPGPGQIFIEEGQDVNRHYKNIAYDLMPLDLALKRGQILENHWTAGNTFRVLAVKLDPSGRDCTQALNRINSSSDATGGSDAAADARRSLKLIYENMDRRNWRMVCLFCVAAAEMAESVQRVTPCHPSNTKYRMIEALEALEDALGAVRRVGKSA